MTTLGKICGPISFISGFSLTTLGNICRRQIITHTKGCSICALLFLRRLIKEN